MDVVENEPAGASHCFDCREQEGVVQSHAKVLCALGGGHRGVVNPDGEVLERAGLPQEEEQLCHLEVELEVVGRHPSRDICQACRDICRHLGVRRWEREK